MNLIRCWMALLLCRSTDFTLEFMCDTRQMNRHRKSISQCAERAALCTYYSGTRYAPMNTKFWCNFRMVANEVSVII